MGRYSLGGTICLVAILLYTVTFFVLQVRLYKGLHMQMYDLGYFDQALYNSLHGHFLETSLRFPEGKSLFAEHIYLIMLLILPIYALFPHPYTLFFLQAFGAGIGAWAVFLIAKHKLQNEVAATCFGLAYLLHPSLQGSTLNLYIFGFHPENLFPPLLLFAYYFLSTDRIKSFVLFFILALMPIEQNALPLAALGLYLFTKERRYKKIGGGVLGASLLWLLGANLLNIFYFRGGSLPWYLERAVMRVTSSTLPVQLWEAITILPGYLLSLLAPLLFLPLFDPPLLATTLPALLVNLSAVAMGYSYPLRPDSWHVSAILPVLFLASVSSIEKFIRRTGKEALAAKLLNIGSMLMLLTAACCTYLIGSLPLSRSLYPNQYQVNEVMVQSVREIKRLLPPDASLAVTRYVGSNFTQRHTLLRLRDRAWKGADYVLLDLNPSPYGWVETEAQQLLGRLRRRSDYELLYSQNNLWLFRRKPPPIEHPVSANLGNMVQLLGYDLNSERLKPGDRLQLTLYWQAMNKMKTNYTVFTHLIDQDDRIWGQKDNWPVNGTYPTTQWIKGEIVIDRYDIIIDRCTPSGRYALEIGVYDLATNQRLPILDAQGAVKDNAIILGNVWVASP